MLKKVDSPALQQAFDGVWKVVYEQENYELEPYHGSDCVRYVVYSNDVAPVVVGTFEVLFDYSVNGADYEHYYPFSTILPNPQRVGIIQKVAILPEYTKEGYLEMILKGINYVQDVYALEYGVAFISPVLYRALRWTYEVNIQKAPGAKILEYKGDIIVPAVLDFTSRSSEMLRYRYGPQDFIDQIQPKKVSNS